MAAMYLLLSRRVIDQWRKLVERLQPSGEQVDRWTGTLALHDLAPRPQMRPTRAVQRESRTHYQPPP